MKILFTRQAQVIVIIFCILISSLTSSFAADSFEIKNYIEAILGASRGPLAALCYQNHANKTGKAKIIHCATDLVRIAHGICAIINHTDDRFYALGIRGAWVTFDAINFYNDLFPQSMNVQDDLIELSAHDNERINRLINVSQLFLLPALESITAFYQAIAHEQTAQAQVNRRQAQALCSLAQATSIFLNNRQSKAAIVLLTAALSETMLATHSSISFSQANEPGNISPVNQLQRSQEASNPGYPQRSTQGAAHEQPNQETVQTNEQLAQIDEEERRNAAQNTETLEQLRRNQVTELERLRRNHAIAQATQEEQFRRDQALAQARWEERQRILDRAHAQYQQEYNEILARMAQAQTQEEQRLQQAHDRAQAQIVQDAQAREAARINDNVQIAEMIRHQEERANIALNYTFNNLEPEALDQFNDFLTRNPTDEELQEFIRNAQN